MLIAIEPAHLACGDSSDHGTESSGGFPSWLKCVARAVADVESAMRKTIILFIDRSLEPKRLISIVFKFVWARLYR